MELHLGLALSLIPTQMITSCLDLKQTIVSGHHHSSSASIPAADEYHHSAQPNRKKQTFVQTKTTLPLLSCHQNQEEEEEEEEEEDPHDHHESHSSTAKKDDDDEDAGVVGWPPIKSWRRKKKCHRYRRRLVVGGMVFSSYVKVKMEGVTIARKIDLSQHNSFESLSNCLFSMFGIRSDWSNYVLTYQDKHGDWFVAEDRVPWRSLVESVQRLKLQRC